VTLYSEGDVYPRPRYNTPASYLELFDAVLRADGTYHGIFKYILDYTSPFSYETGYAKYHKKNLPLLESITRIFAQKTGYGVYIPIDQNDFSYADFTISDAFQNNYPLATAGKFLSSLSIPTTYQRNAYRCTALAGETAQRYPLSELQSDSGAILDAVAALHLQKRGLDVGLSDTDIRFLTSNAQGLRSKENDFTVCHKRNNGRFAIANLKRECRVLLEMTVAGEGRIPFFYQYQNADGMRFLVCLADWMGFSQDSYVMRGYPIQNVLMDASEWISGARLPVRIEKQPELYVICKRSEDGQKMSVGLFNCFADAVLSPTVTLDTEYRNACFFGCDGRLEQDRIYLQADIPAFSFAAFEVTK